MAQDAPEETYMVALPIGLLGFMAIEGKRMGLSLEETLTVTIIAGMNYKYYEAGHAHLANMFADYGLAWAGTNPARLNAMEIEPQRQPHTTDS